MRGKIILVIVFIILLVSFTFFYFMPLNSFNLTAKSQNSNFSIAGNLDMQYYPNMRYSDPSISYKISNCSIDKGNQMQYAFEIMQNITNLKFYPVENDEQISVTCLEKNKIENGMFIAGEGGPTSIILSGDFYMITKGEILLIRNSDCPTPNVALHELLHSLGFKHSSNPNNIMYNVTSCDQTIGQDTINLINELYSVPSYPDLTFENVSGVMNGRFLNVNLTVMNEGLNDADASKIIIYADNASVREINLDSIKVGEGISLNLENVLISKINFNEISLEIVSNFSEITKENNKIKLEIKK
jgi:Matrixin/CARDB